MNNIGSGKIGKMLYNKSNLRDLIAPTGLVILHKLDSTRATLKFNGWPGKIIWHLFYTASSFVHHFKSINEFKLELQSRNAQFGSKLTIFFSRVTLQFDVWPWKTIGHFFYATSSFVHHFVAIGEFKLELQSGNAQFWSNWTIFRAVWPWNLMYDLQNNKAPLLCYFKLCAAFCGQGEFKLEFQSGNAQSGSNLMIFLAVWPWNLTDDLEKQ